MDAIQESVTGESNYYAKFMETLVEIKRGEEKLLTGISIRRLPDRAYINKDSYAYKMNGSYCDLFTSGYGAKEAFHKVYVMLKEREQ